MARVDPSMSASQGWDAFKAAEAIAAESASASDSGQLFPTYASELGLLAEECEFPGPTTELRKVAENAISIDQVSKFAQAGAKLAVLRNCGASFHPAASGIRCWGTFCYTACRPHFPPSEGGVLAWPSSFATRRSFQIYVAHLERPRIHLGLSAAWKPKAVISAGCGLAKSGGKSFA